MPRRLNFLLMVALSTACLIVGCTAPIYLTPLEEAEGDSLTSHSEMHGFLENLQRGTQAFTIDTVGTSIEGRSLVALHFSGIDGESSAEPLKVLIFAQQHGDEPSGKEALVALVRDLATGSLPEVLQSVDLWLIPQVNADGSEMRQRRNAAGMDLNRDHVTLSSPEVLAVHSVFQETAPHVVLDVHEYGIMGSSWIEAGLRKDFGQQIGALSNANMSLELRTFAWDRVIPWMRDELVPKGVDLNRYLVTGGPEARFRFSTAGLNDGRNSTGIYNTLSFLIEGRNGLSVEENIRERTRQQLETIKAFLSFFAENVQEVRGLVEGEKIALAESQAPADVSLVMDYVKDPAWPTMTVGVIDLETGEPESLEVEDFHPVVEASLSVTRPMGYLIPAHLTEILEVLERHRIPIERVDTPFQALVEAYQIRSVEPILKEDKDFLEVGVSVIRETMEIPAGHIFVRCDQIQSNLIVTLLEPQSQWGLAPLPEFSFLLDIGSQYPVWRIMGLTG